MAKKSFRPDLAGRARKSFQKANPENFGRIQHNEIATRQLAGIEMRSENAKKQMRAHFQKFGESWVAREAIVIWRHQTKATLQHPSPRYAQSDLSEAAIMNIARRNVKARMTTRLSKVNEIRSRMQNAIVRTHQKMTQQQAPKIQKDFKKTQTLRRTLS